MKRTITPDQVKQLRQRAGLTQEEFTVALGTTARTVSRWEKGQTPARMAQRALMQFEAELLAQAEQHTVEARSVRS